MRFSCFSPITLAFYTSPFRGRASANFERISQFVIMSPDVGQIHKGQMSVVMNAFRNVMIVENVSIDVYYEHCLTFKYSFVPLPD